MIHEYGATRHDYVVLISQETYEYEMKLPLEFYKA